MRGEHEVPERPPPPSPGSPPHARGAPGRLVGSVSSDGITPACAGSTFCGRVVTSLCRDHPRMRGEHHPIFVVAGAEAGSPPHARGARGDFAVSADAFGITPACAGSTVGEFPIGSGVEDHPRMRGEHRLPAALVSAPSGSPPHARGAPYLNRDNVSSANHTRSIRKRAMPLSTNHGSRNSKHRARLD